MDLHDGRALRMAFMWRDETCKKIVWILYSFDTWGSEHPSLTWLLNGPVSL